MRRAAVGGPALPALARASVEEALARDEFPAASIPPSPASGPVAATFVTIRKNGMLRGCMGTTVARRSLLDDVKSQARAAAFRDPRFSPIQREELSELHFEVSVLGEPAPLVARTWEEACAAVRPHVDGVIVRTDVGGALFLPQVWESIGDPCEFLEELWKKAGLPHHYFEADVELSIFSVEKFEEPLPRGAR